MRVDDVIGETLYPGLFAQAEAVRWRMQDIPWSQIERGAVTSGLRQLVREIAFSELTTATATRRFLTDLADDVDLTQWIAVWFYEETKHPHALLTWLHHLGERVDGQFVQRGRATAPFMRSRMGTLVTNIISEMVASAGYAALAARAAEPVLRRIARHLAGDEARHAASFYVYARRHLERSAEPAADRRDALKVLYLWYAGSALVGHPVSEFYGRHEQRPEIGETMAQLGFNLAAPRDRISQLIGTLLDLELDGSVDLVALMRTLEPPDRTSDHGAT
ncbi:MAG: hypothetical protein E6J90_13035 [Deltaproteobacteria bacterium]|nr:MAG: hypothetical protein E6J90_13035 [Deltaproteobacteria bacterium]